MYAATAAAAAYISGLLEDAFDQASAPARP
jgi:hypothetical protein